MRTMTARLRCAKQAGSLSEYESPSTLWRRLEGLSNKAKAASPHSYALSGLRNACANTKRPMLTKRPQTARNDGMLFATGAVAKLLQGDSKAKGAFRKRKAQRKGNRLHPWARRACNAAGTSTCHNFRPFLKMSQDSDN